MYLLNMVKYCTISNKRLFLCNMSNSRLLLLCFLVLCFAVACKSDPPYDPAQQLAIDDDLIVKYMAANNITATKDSHGLYYSIINPGSTTDNRTTTLQDIIVVHYIGRIMKSQLVFDSTDTNVDTLSTKFLLSDVIEGWQLGIPKIKEGGRIRLLVPSTLAYQNRQIDTLLKANSILDFDIRVIKVTDPSQIKP